MKKTSIIMLALVIIGFVLIEVIIIYASSTLHTFKYNITDNCEEPRTIQLNPFSSIRFEENEPSFFLFSNEGTFIVKQSDSVSSPKLIVPRNIEKFISTKYNKGWLVVSFKEVDQESSDEHIQNMINLTMPMQVVIPDMPDSIVNNFVIPLVISGKSTGNNLISTRGDIQFKDTYLDTVTLLGGSRMSANYYKPAFEKANIKYLLLKDSRRTFFIQSDSVSQVEEMLILGTPDYEQKFTPGNLKINKFTFIPSDSMSRITLTDYSVLTTSFNTSK